MPSFARVLIDRSEGRELDYSVPEELTDSVVVGSRVVVMVRNRRAIGTVMGLSTVSEVPGIRPISGLVEEEVSLTPVLMRLARWIADYYCATPSSVFKAMLPPAVRGERIPGRRVRTATLTRMPSPEDLTRIGRKSPRQGSLLEHLASSGKPLDVPELLRMAGGGESSLRTLVAAGWVLLGERRADVMSGEEILPSRIPDLNPDQAIVIGRILEALHHPSSEGPPETFLLHGVTGSGKTEVYLRTIEAALDSGKSALVLVPEIALTPQTVERFRSRFDGAGHGVAVLHSHLGEAERREEWLRIRRGEARIVIGARSAVFAPLRDLGILIVDEEHEGTYKQEESPRYHARDVAVMRARLEGCPVVLGSATPSVESYRNALAGKYRLLELPRRADGQKMPLIRVVDLKLQGKRARSDGGLSAPLQMAITRRLELGQQIILFLNRRGYSTSVLCEACGHVCRCPNCSLSLTLHRAQERMACHLCGHTARPPLQCPECRDPGIRHSGIGTQRVEETLRKLYPKARIARMDADTMTRKGSYAEVLGDFRARRTDILLGTQMIAKGLDFPNVTLVGIVNADTGLHSPDFRAGERTFQLLTQVSGRAGRGETEGEVVIQTYSPASPSIQHARHHDFAGFYEQEVSFREAFGHPPFQRLLLVRIRGESEEQTRSSAEALAGAFRSACPADVSVSVAAPAPIERSHGQYRYHVTLKGVSGLRLASLYREVSPTVSLPAGVVAVPDVDPASLL